MVDEDGETYRGITGAFPFAFRTSESWLFRSYVVLGGALAVLVAVLFLGALVVLIADTGGTGGGTETFVRAFFILVALFVIGPLVAPVLFVARRHRRQGSSRSYDAALAATGYLFALSVYTGILVSTPEAQQPEVSGIVAGVVEPLYELEQPLGLIPPVLAAVAMVIVHLRLR